MTVLEIPAAARLALEELARLRSQSIPTDDEQAAARQRAQQERDRHEERLAVARRVMDWAHRLAGAGVLAGLGDVRILRYQEGRTTWAVSVNGTGELSLVTGSYMGGTSRRCQTAEELAGGFVDPARIEAAIASGEVWEHLARGVAEEGKRRRRPPTSSGRGER